MALFFAACEDEAEFVQQKGVELFPEPYGIEVKEASMSYSEYGVFECGSDGELSMGTSGDLAIKLRIVNTTNAVQIVCRQHFKIDLDGKATMIPTFLYNSDMRTKRFVTINPHEMMEVVVYFENAFGHVDLQWLNKVGGINEVYSLDVLLANNYVYGCDLYAHPAKQGRWVARH